MRNMRVTDVRTAADVEIERQLSAIQELENHNYDDTFVFSIPTIITFLSGRFKFEI